MSSARPPLPPPTVERRRDSKVKQVLSAVQPVYLFEASIDCQGPSMDRQKKKGLLGILEGELLVSDWTRDGMNFVKKVSTVDGDLGQAEDEFITALTACYNLHVPEGDITSLKVTFNSSTVQLVSADTVTV